MFVLKCPYSAQDPLPGEESFRGEKSKRKINSSNRIHVHLEVPLGSMGLALRLSVYRVTAQQHNPVCVCSEESPIMLSGAYSQESKWIGLHRTY